jgi:DNA adenine methylase
MPNLTQATPFLKWAGGKQALAPSLIARFPRRFSRYFEPFVGGASVAFGLGHKHTVIGDANEWLIDTYVCIRDDWARVATLLDRLNNTKDDYLEIRSIDPASIDAYRRAAHFIYLNKAGFRGLFRVNGKGRFNVPYGGYDRRYYDPATLAQCAAALASFSIRVGDFETTLDGVASGDFVYMDPPYYKLGGYSDFNRYTPGQFRERDHVRLASVCRELDQRGVRWAVSNSNTDFVRELFVGFNFVEVTTRREINLNSASRAISELLVMNYANDATKCSLEDRSEA